MSVANGVSKYTTSLGTGTGLAVSPSTSTSSVVPALPSGPLVTYCGSPRSGPGMNLPYGSTASIGTFVTSRSTSLSPSTCSAWSLSDAQVAMPVVPSGAVGYVPPAARPPSSLPVATGLPLVVSLTYSRRNTWCDGCEVYVWLWSTQGESVLVASWMSSAVPRMLSGPGWFCARVSTMNCSSGLV